MNSARGSVISPKSGAPSGLRVELSLKQGRAGSQASNGSENDHVDENDSEDDEADDDDYDGSDPKKPGVKWSAEEQAAVFNFYGIQAHFPQTWGETRDDIGNSPTHVGSIVTDTGPSKIELLPLPLDSDGGIDTSDPLEIKDSVLGRGKRRKTNLSRAEAELYGPLLIGSKKFDAKQFLREVHRSTSYRDLDLGAERLRESIDLRQDVIKNLVKTHFAKFVSAKSTIDSFYEQMRTKNLISSQDYGLAPFAKMVDGVKVDASALYTPLLERRVKAEKIRTTLTVLNQWKFFFNLPSVLQGYQAKYDAIVRDYQKGKYLMQSSFGSTSRRIGTSANAKDKDALLPQHHQKVFEKVWEEVEKIVSQCREALYKHLGDSWVPLDTQERVLSYLTELNAEPNPVQYYLDKQYESILERLKQTFDKHLRSLENLEIDDVIGPQQFTITQLRRGLNSVQSQEFEEALINEPTVKLFRVTLRLVRNLCDIITDALPDFWKLCRIYCEGRFQKKSPDAELVQGRGKKRLDARKMEQCQSRIKNIFDLFNMLLSRIFFIDVPLPMLRSMFDARTNTGSAVTENTDISTQSQTRSTPETSATTNQSLDPTVSATSDLRSPSVHNIDSQATPIPGIMLPVAISYKYAAFLRSHPLVACFYFIKIISEFAQCHQEVRAIKMIGDDLLPTLTTGMAKVQTRAVDAICDVLVEESRNFYLYEDWSFEIDNPTGDVAQTLTANAAIAADSTALLKLFYRLQKYVIRCLNRIASVPLGASKVETASSGSGNTIDHRSSNADDIPRVLVQQIKHAHIQSHYVLLDGLQWLAINWRPDTTRNANGIGGTEGGSSSSSLRASLLGSDTQLAAMGGEARAMMGNAPIWKRKAKSLDVNEIGIRILIVLGNLAFMRVTVVPKLFGLLQEKLNVSFKSDCQDLLDIIAHLDAVLFRNYIKAISTKVHIVIQRGILFSGLDWNSLPRPSEVRPYCLRILLTLVMVHAEVSDVSRLLVHRVISELLSFLAQDLLQTFRSVDQYSPAGMLQGTMETEFLHQTLAAFETPESTKLLNLVYDTLERSVDDHELALVETAAGNRISMKEMLHSVKSMLADAKRSTSVEFSCFSTQNLTRSESVDDGQDEDD
ncbi:exocyst complex component Sec5-domain-containing protein [Phlyctochytrium arcticum]|nr:exocyst complex component Sec5-domain-containing protein [Phlyctochytrium arcticum]